MGISLLIAKGGKPGYLVAKAPEQYSTQLDLRSVVCRRVTSSRLQMGVELTQKIVHPTDCTVQRRVP
jgi:hypothetical protein